MKKYLAIILLALVAGCGVKHKVHIPHEPCLYPSRDYDFVLCHEFPFIIDDKQYEVHQGFSTDLASVPRILWSIYSPTQSNTIPAAIIHDYFYFCPGDMTREEADRIFYDALISQEVNSYTAFKYWAAVRTFGSSHFNEGAVCSFTVSGVDNTNGQHKDIGVG